MINLLDKNGFFNLSFPILEKYKIEFNNQRVFNSKYILGLEFVSQNLELVRFYFIDKYDHVNLNQNVN